MATVSGLFTSPGKASGISTPHERATAVVGTASRGAGTRGATGVRSSLRRSSISMRSASIPG